MGGAQLGAARDAPGFTRLAPGPGGLALSADGKGAAMRPEAERRGRGGVRVKTFGKRLGSGEKAGHKRMAEVGVVFDVVSDDSSACGRAARDLAQVVIADVREDPGFAAHREIAGNSGFQAVQSTPLVDQDSRLLGMLSTH